MANIKLGAIVTDIAGSISGTTFRRTPRGIIAYNKQGTQIKSAFASASKKNQLGVVFASWSSLSSELVAFWNDKAALYPQLNKFGELVYLTGRQFYTKLNTQLIPTNTAVDPSAFSAVLPDAVVTGVELIPGSGVAAAYFDKLVTVEHCLVRIQQTRSAFGSVKPHAHFRNTDIQRLEDDNQVRFAIPFAQQFPFAQVGDNFIIHIIFMNASGFQTSVQGFIATIQ